MPKLPVLLLLCLAAVGCSSSEEDEAVDDSAGAFGDRVGHDQLSTTEPGITLFDGYNTLFDLRRTQCVRPSPDYVAQVGQTFQQTTIKIVRSDVELAREIGVDASFALKAPMASAQGSAALLRSFKGSSTNVNYLIQAVQSYTVQSNAPFALTAEASALLRTSPHDFLVRCGDRFVSGVVYQAKIEALITFETQSEETALSLQSSISGAGPTSVAQLDGSITAKLTDASRRSGVSTSISVTAQGFDVSGDYALVGVGGTVEEKMTRLDAVAGQMGSSLRADRDRDARGFDRNTLRSAIPAGVQLARYGDAANAPTGVESSATFREHLDLLRHTERYLRAFGQLRHQIENAYLKEISPFLHASLEAQAGYNLAPPAAPKRFAPELRSVAYGWLDRFRSDDGLDVGTDTAKVQDAIARCVDGAKLGDFSGCRPGIDPGSLGAYQEGARALAEYRQSGRIVKLRASVVANGADRTYGAARAACAVVDGSPGRLPTAEEARRLAPLVAGAGGGAKSSIWIAPTPSCSEQHGGMPFFENQSGGAAREGCDGWNFFAQGARAVVCVPQSGPTGPDER